MASIKAKRSVRNKQSALSNQQSAKSKNKDQRTQTRSSAAHRYRKLFHFPQAKGKLVEDVEFSTTPGYHNLSINFQDKTSLNFEVDTDFTLGADYSDWKTGNQRVIREWRPIRSYR